MGTPPAYNQATSPISPSQFKDVLDAICKPRWRMARWARPRSIVLAISGGVDSMALAYLFSATAKTWGQGFRVADNPVSVVCGVVIDHGLREGSKEESRKVAGWLQNLGIRSRSVGLGQKARRGYNIDLQSLPSFETAARLLRYRTLGLNTTDFGATSLFTAHHQDDQYETILMRLLDGHKYRGLQGIRAANPIPESYDIHGVYGSGLIDDQHSSLPYLSFKPTNRAVRRLRVTFQEDQIGEMLDQPESSQRQKPADYFPGQPTRTFDPHAPYLTPLPCEDGGVTLYRPLLSFDKDQLRATCEANKVPWVEDHTNSDRTLTTRNAVRHMIRYHTLPEALQKPVILALSDRARRRVEFEEAEAMRLVIREAIIKDFDTNVGTLLVELPAFRTYQRPGGRLYWRARREAWRPHQRRTAGLVIRKLMEYVTPDTHLPSLGNLDTAIDRLFPELKQEEQRSEPKAFSIGAVMFDPVVGKGTVRWLLSRAPYPSRGTRPRIRSSEHPRQKCGPHGTEVDASSTSSPWRKWKDFQLYDGRFWVKVSFGIASSPFTIRPYEPELGKAFRRQLPVKQRIKLERLLKFFAPGKVRTTLPAIYSAGSVDDEAHTPVLLGLPTLRIHLPGLEKSMSYETRYRNVDMSLLGHRKKGDGVPSFGHRWTPSESLVKRRQRLRRGAHCGRHSIWSE